MAQGSGDGIKVSLDAMRSDAELWRRQAQAMSGPKRELGALHLDGAALSYFSMEAGLGETLETLRTAVGDLLEQGQKYFEKIADDLDAAAKQYQADDEAGVHELSKDK
ncbi:hypothetical protein [Saccharopolyspora mangrovi]|uniref:ESX-1 secretion-associated protein n=1 Tax=Saccharopolyspora mangrovi TaxID=3082379 RepID=A0ABU6A831_9PSEU|nr:hypothetical protein [Saccharopolyspora sp. S2-29]MEB3367544.1 hypothetical protein [Saccharopolyspora sp. S2-29]